MAVTVLDADEVATNLQSPIITIERGRDIEASDGHLRARAQIALHTEHARPGSRRWQRLIRRYIGALRFRNPIDQGAIADKQRLIAAPLMERPDRQ